jgi:hypothetical protein
VDLPRGRSSVRIDERTERGCGGGGSGGRRGRVSGFIDLGIDLNH